MNLKVSPFSSMLEAEDETSGKGDFSSKNSTESSVTTRGRNSTESTKTSKSNESMNTTIIATSNEREPVSTMLRRRCDKCSDDSVTSPSESYNYIGQIKPIVSECCITDTNTVILCGEVTNENASSTISPCGVEVAMQYLTKTKTNTFYETECVQILDSIPLDSDDIQEEDIDYFMIR